MPYGSKTNSFNSQNTFQGHRKKARGLAMSLAISWSFY